MPVLLASIALGIWVPAPGFTLGSFYLISTLTLGAVSGEMTVLSTLVATLPFILAVPGEMALLAALMASEWSALTFRPVWSLCVSSGVYSLDSRLRSGLAYGIWNSLPSLIPCCWKLILHYLLWGYILSLKNERSISTTRLLIKSSFSGCWLVSGENLVEAFNHLDVLLLVEHVVGTLPCRVVDSSLLGNHLFVESHLRANNTPIPHLRLHQISCLIWGLHRY